MSKNIRVALAGAGAFGIKHLDAIKLIDGVEVALVSRELDKTASEVAARSTASATARRNSPTAWRCPTSTR